MPLPRFRTYMHLQLSTRLSLRLSVNESVFGTLGYVRRKSVYLNTERKIVRARKTPPPPLPWKYIPTRSALLTIWLSRVWYSLALCGGEIVYAYNETSSGFEVAMCCKNRLDPQVASWWCLVCSTGASEDFFTNTGRSHDKQACGRPDTWLHTPPRSI